MVRRDPAWQAAIPFLKSSVEWVGGQCGRHDTVAGQLEGTGCELDIPGALVLLEDVSQPDTQFSVVYNTSTGNVGVAMGRDYDHVVGFQLEMLDR